MYMAVTTRYGLDGPGSNPCGLGDFPDQSWQILEPTRPPIQWVPILFPVGKSAGTWGLPSTPSSYYSPLWALACRTMSFHFCYLPPTLFIFSLPALEDLFLLPLSIFSSRPLQFISEDLLGHPILLHSL